MSVIDQKEYLKKYLSGDKDEKKKKKRKKKPAVGDRVTIIDDDIDISHLTTVDEAAELFAMSEDAPQIVKIYDERPVHMSDRWKPMSAPGSQPTASEPSDFKQKVSLIIKKADQDRQLEDSALKSKSKHRSEASPRSRESPARRRDVDYSPPRRGRKEGDSSPRRRRRDSNSPVRRRRSLDSSPTRRRDSNSPPRIVQSGDSSPPRRKRRNSDNSPPRNPPRKSRFEDNSPPRRRRDSDSSLPRKSHNADSNPARRRRDSDNSPPRKSRDEDISPPRRRRREFDNSPPRTSRDEDVSPPRRRRRNSDSSPPRKRRDVSPPRKTRRSVSPRRPNDSSKKEPVPPEKPRKLLPGDHKGRYLIPQKRGKMTKTLEGKSAGLQNKDELIKENQAFREREAELFKNMSAEVSGVGAAPILRDRQTGKIRDLEKEAEEKREKEKEEAARKELYSRWGRGLKQVEAYEDKLSTDLHEMNKPLARYANDEDLEKFLKEQERDGDPMLAYLRKKKKKKVVESKQPLKPEYEGEFAPNRFGIRPGYRWDGVDRSSGYEKKWFEVQNAKRAIMEEVYKWSTEDM